MKIHGISTFSQPSTFKGYSPQASCRQAAMIADDFLIPELKGKKINSLCDLGCGNGDPTKVLANKLKISPDNFIGVDNTRYGDLSLGGKQFEKASMSNYLKNTDKKFDMISLCRPDCFTDAMYYENYVPKLLTSVANRLNDDGYFFVYGSSVQLWRVKAALDKAGVKYATEGYHDSSISWTPSSLGPRLQTFLISKEEILKGFSR